MKKYQNDLPVSESRPILDGFLPLQMRDGSNAVISEYIWGLTLGGGIGGLLDLRQGGQNYSYLYDGKGNVTALLDASQAVAVTYTYDTFGTLMSQTGSLSQPFKFSTKMYDEQTGLSYFGYRFYSPILGRWITRDPIGFNGGDLNLYLYAWNQPTMSIDPFGLTPQDRVNYVMNQYLYNKNAWKGEVVCNEFVAAAHTSGDPDARNYPSVSKGLLRGSRPPLVRELADPYFEAALLDTFHYLDAQPGDIIVWYNEASDVHHSGIYVGDGNVVYQNANQGIKMNTIDGVPGGYGEPIVRRYIYPLSN